MKDCVNNKILVTALLWQEDKVGQDTTGAGPFLHRTKGQNLVSDRKVVKHRQTDLVKLGRFTLQQERNNHTNTARGVMKPQ